MGEPKQPDWIGSCPDDGEDQEDNGRDYDEADKVRGWDYP